MHTTLVAFLSELADSRMMKHVKTGRVLSGLLKIYQDRDGIPRRVYAVSFSRIAEHIRNECIRLQVEHNVNLSFTETDLRRAIASFQPSLGSGRKAHVVIRSDARKIFDAEASAAQREIDRTMQEQYLAEFVVVDSPLPSLTISVDGVLTTV